ncbi:hypothetical protein OF897_18835 [Chryseobacterium formosus]|uniref:Uncharacterized protein n=1 Tax=Chryseobacterium formosus TaxID=1537363 RepID=A0ABT3XWD5_9FLAO|nr:hypothetical protein [Chryseobacterium formosus]MCX8525974.1 hypothetical protein [Chryseobacterium formosus]
MRTAQIFTPILFKIKRENAPETAPLENLLLIPTADGSYKEFLVTYNLTPQEREKVRNGEPVNTKGKTTITELADGTFNSGGQLAKSTMVCGWSNSVHWARCSDGIHGESTYGSCQFVGDFVDNAGNPGFPPYPYLVSTYSCVEQVDETLMPTDPGVGGGGGGGPAGNGPDECTTVANNPGEVGIIDENGCHVGGATQPNDTRPKQKYPCEQLESLGGKQYFKNRMDQLKNNVDSGTQEYGFALHDNINTPISYLLMGSGQSNSNTIDFSTYYSGLSNDMANSLYGNAHNHLANDSTHVGIFPPDDLALLSLFGIIETLPQSTFYNPIPKKAVIYLITDKGLFALKITNLQKLKAYVIKYANMLKTGESANYLKEMFQDEDGYNIQHDSTHDELVTGFLRFIVDEDIGIDLYEGDKDTYQSWKKLELLDNGNGNFSFNEIPCNL